MTLEKVFKEKQDIQKGNIDTVITFESSTSSSTPDDNTDDQDFTGAVSEVTPNAKKKKSDKTILTPLVLSSLDQTKVIVVRFRLLVLLLMLLDIVLTSSVLVNHPPADTMKSIDLRKQLN